MTQTRRPWADWPDQCHPSHETRISDASSFDEICKLCGATDIAGGGWGALRMPCNAKKTQEPAPRAARTFNMTEAMRIGLGYDEMGNNPDLMCAADLQGMPFIQRASGEVTCRCGTLYRNHPPVQGALYLTRTCEGIFKL